MAELIVPAHLRKRHDDGMQRYLSSGRSVILGRPVEMEALRADGTVFPIELAIAEMRQAGRRLFTAFLRDITNRRTIERALRDRQHLPGHYIAGFYADLGERARLRDELRRNGPITEARISHRGKRGGGLAAGPDTCGGHAAGGPKSRVERPILDERGGRRAEPCYAALFRRRRAAGRDRRGWSGASQQSSSSTSSTWRWSRNRRRGVASPRWPA